MPKLGLFVWTLLIFVAVFFVLRKYAWKPILKALHEREESITSSLEEAKRAKEEMAQLKADNETLLREARSEREKIVKSANEQGEKIIREAKAAAAEAQAKEVEKARQQITAEKNAALAEIKNTAASLAVEVAEKILRQELSDQAAQENLARKLVDEIQQN